MRICFFLLFALVLITAACKKEKSQKPVEEKDPIFVGDNTTPVEIRTYNKAKEVKKQVEQQQKENKKILEEGN